MNSENKYLLLISVGPKIASLRPRAEQKPARLASKFSLCGLASRCRRASSEQQRSKVGFPIRKFTDQSLFAAPHDLSQRTTSFIASQRQGIHRIPLRHLIALIIDAHRSAAVRHITVIESRNISSRYLDNEGHWDRSI